MADLFQQTIPNLISGVSQQAPSLRRKTDAEAQQNCRNDPVYGMGKRYNTTMLAEVSGLGNPAGYVQKTIVRDDEERYKLLVTNGEVRVLDLYSGFEYTVITSAAALDYLSIRGSTSPQEAFQLLNVIDTTFILNKTVPVRYVPFNGSTETPPNTEQRVQTITLSKTKYPYSDKPGLYGHSGHQYYYKFTINGTVYTYADAEDSLSKVTSQVKNWIDSEYPAVTLRQLSSSTIQVILDPSESVSVTGSWHYDADYEENTDAGTHVQFNLSGSCVTSHIALQVLPTPTPMVPSALWYIKQADYATEYHVKLNGIDCQIKTPEATSTQAREGLRTLAMTVDMQSAINALNGSHGCTATLMDNVLYIQADANSDFTISTSDDLADRGAYAIKEWVESFDELPPSAPVDYTVEVRGDPEVDTDPYHVKYVETDDDGNEIVGIWKETVKYGVATDLDLDTLPFSVNRKQDDLYVEVDNPLGIYFEVENSEFTSRTVGDDLTAPMPSFVSEQDENGHITSARYIHSMSLSRNRMILCADTNFVASETGQYLNFFPTTVTTVLPADPFDVALNINAVHPIKHIVESKDGLFLFSKKAQLLVEAQEAFTADTIKIQKVSNYEVDVTIPPFVEGQYVYFFNKGRKYSVMMELYQVDGTDKYEAKGVTEHLPTYIEGQVIGVEHSTLENQMFILTSNGTGIPVHPLHVHNYLLQGHDCVQNA